MEIKRVGYGRLVMGERYEQVRYYLEAEVEPGENWRKTEELLEEEVDGILTARKHTIRVTRECHEMERTKEQLQLEINQLEGKFKSLQLRWNNAVEFVRRHGVDPAVAGLMEFCWEGGDEEEEEDEDEEDPDESDL